MLVGKATIYSVLLLLRCLISGKLPDLSVFIPVTSDLSQVSSPLCASTLSCGIIDKLSDLSVLSYLSGMILGKLPNHSVLPHLSCVLVGKVINLSVLPFLSCVTLGKLPDLCVF